MQIQLQSQNQLHRSHCFESQQKVKFSISRQLTNQKSKGLKCLYQKGKRVTNWVSLEYSYIKDFQFSLFNVTCSWATWFNMLLVLNWTLKCAWDTKSNYYYGLIYYKLVRTEQMISKNSQNAFNFLLFTLKKVLMLLICICNRKYKIFYGTVK